MTLFALLLATAAPPAVVINEVFYHAPDDLDRVQWVELHNPGPQPVDLGGWTLDRGKLLTVPAATVAPAGGYLVFALDPEEFSNAYGPGVTPLGPLKRPLKRGGERLELRDAAGAVVDVARYKDDAPWPASADGRSASLERICPAAPGDTAENWAGSPLPSRPRPAGTPGKANTAYSATPLPVVSAVTAPTTVPPDKPLTVTATVAGADEVKLSYRVVTAAGGGGETSVPMTRGADGRWTADIPGPRIGTLLRYRVRAVGMDRAVRHYPAEHDLRPTLSAYVCEPFSATPLARGILFLGPADRKPPPQIGGRERGARDTPNPPRGQSAFVRVDPAGKAVEVFDHISAVPRTQRPGAGFVLHFHKDRPYHGQTAASLFNEGSDRWLLDEALSYDLYRRAGVAAPLTEFVRLTIDGRSAGHHLLVERPNKAFLRRNGVDAGGNLYKVIWQGDGLAGTHIKKTNVRGGHGDLQEIVAKFERTRGKPAEQWAVIRERCDVDQMAGFFAVNMVLSHWDGYFNNHFAYHDTKRGKWQLYPWDHDQAWGEGPGDEQLSLTRMPLLFGTDAAAPPPGVGWPGWWRPGGVFSRPLLANPQFRPVFLAKVRSVLEEHFTEAVYGPAIDELVGRLKADAKLRAAARGGNPQERFQSLDRDAAALKTFLTKRRAFLLAQDELKR